MTNTNMKKTTQSMVHETSQHKGGKIWNEIGGACSTRYSDVKMRSKF